MVWYGAPPTPRQCVLSMPLRAMASCSVHPVARVKEQHRQAMRSGNAIRACSEMGSSRL
jgi:hypothetical protein